jgi:hypothetical protein
MKIQLKEIWRNSKPKELIIILLRLMKMRLISDLKYFIPPVL